MITIQTHDGLYDEANKKYLMTYMPEQKPRTALPFIIHQGDFMAARIEWERDWLPKLNSNVSISDKNSIVSDKKITKLPAKSKALGSIKSNSLKDMLDNL
jgi:hypothetical protein